MGCTVTAWFDLASQGGDFFTLDDTTKGELDNVTYLLSGDLPTEITGDSMTVSVARGRSRRLDTYQAGTCTVTLVNTDRAFDPTNDASVYAGNIRPGKRVMVSCEGVPIFGGNIEDWNLSYEPGGFAVASFTAVDRLGVLANRRFSAHTTSAGQLPGPRIAAELDRTEVDFPAARDLDDGAATLQADSVTFGSNVLNYLQLIEQTEQGYLFASAENVLTFRGRRAVLNRTGSVTFADDGTGISYQGIGVEYGSENLYTRVSVDREGGTAQTVTSTAGRAEYGTRALSLSGLLYDSDAQSLETASALLNRYEAPELRVADVTVVVSALSSSDAAKVVALDLTDVVRVVFTPPGGGAAIDRYCIVDGVSHDVSPGFHRVVLSLADTDRRLFMQLDDAVNGVLDTGVLAW